MNFSLQKQRQAEEQERLRKIQEALEEERKQKEEEERKVREEEENRRKLVFNFIIHLLIRLSIKKSNTIHLFQRKIEIEAKRKMEELERKRQEEEDLRAAVALQVGVADLKQFYCVSNGI